MAKLYRDRFDKKISGVAGGLAQYLKIDSSIIRLILIVLGVFTGGIAFLIYLLMWAILPFGPRAYVEANYKKLYRSRTDRRVSGICGGFGKYFNFDANIIRLVLVILLFVTGIFPIFISYLIAAAIIPEEP